MKLRKLKTKNNFRKVLRRDRTNQLDHWYEKNAEWTGARSKFILQSPYNQRLYLFKIPKYGKLESMIEVFNSILANELDINHVQYVHASYSGVLGVLCESFIPLGKNKELWEMKELICRHSNREDLNKLFGRSKEVLEENNIENIYMVIDAEFGDLNIFKKFFIMIGFDILIGHGDRHWENYGFVVSGSDLEYRFSPIYDTASGYLLEMRDDHLAQNPPDLDDSSWYRPKNKKKLCKISVPGNIKGNHFDLLEYILDNEDMMKYKPQLSQAFEKFHPKLTSLILNRYFSEMPENRKEIVKIVLEKRWIIGKEILGIK